MAKTRTRVAGIATAALGLTAGLVGFAPNASAASCSGVGCDGKGPVATGCSAGAYKSDGTSTGTAYGPAIVDLIFSPNCNAYWARGRSINGTTYTVRIQRLVVGTNEVRYQNDEGIAADQNGGSNNGPVYDWTFMGGQAAQRNIRACVYVSTAHSGDGKWHCTGMHTGA